MGKFFGVVGKHTGSGTHRGSTPNRKGGYMPGKKNKFHRYISKNMSGNKDTTENILTIVVYILQLAVTFLRIYVMTLLYAWFAVPLGAPKVDWPVLYGLYILIAYMGNGDKDVLLTKQDQEYESDFQKQGTKLFYSLAAVLLAWGFAAIWHYWVLA